MLEKFTECLNASYVHIENDASFAVKQDGETLTLYFEKSNGATDWRNNFDFPARPYRDMANGWFCHRGFLRVWKSIEPYIVNKIFDLSISKIDIVGYSHGAAIALLCYEYVKFNRPDVEVSGVGFGCPRVFWGTARRAVMQRFEGFVVVRNGCDLVTHLPPACFGFRHVGKLLKIGAPWNFEDFLQCVAKIGLKAALEEHAHLGSIKDHYPERYIKGLEAQK